MASCSTDCWSALFGVAPAAQALPPGVNFNAIALGGESLVNPTSLAFGPDGRLYVSLKGGIIHAYDVQRTDVDLDNIGEYTVVSTEVIALINSIPNHNDDGTPHAVALRQITGLVATGTAGNPVLYVSSSDYREGGGGGGGDLGLDTNSGIISRLTWNGIRLAEAGPGARSAAVGRKPFHQRHGPR